MVSLTHHQDAMEPGIFGQRCGRQHLAPECGLGVSMEGWQMDDFMVISWYLPGI